MKRCDYCGGKLGMVVHRKWRWRFYKLSCKTAFEHRRQEEARRRIRALLEPAVVSTAGTSLATESARTISAKLKFVLSAIILLGAGSEWRLTRCMKAFCVAWP
jgi:hypothetical protein